MCGIKSSEQCETVEVDICKEESEEVCKQKKKCRKSQAVCDEDGCIGGQKYKSIYIPIYISCTGNI